MFTQLETFVRVAETGSFGKAAETLFITGPAVAKQINQLEKELGVKLLERTRKGVVLTDSGRSYYKDAKNILKIAQEAQARARRLEDEKQVVRIGVSLLTSSDYYAEILPKVHRVCPDLQFQFVPFDNDKGDIDNTMQLLGNSIDVMALFYDKHKNEHYNSFLLSHEKVGCAMSLEHPLAKCSELKPEDLFGSDVYLLKKGANTYIDAIREQIERRYPDIRLKDLDAMRNIRFFDHCVNDNSLVITLQAWDGKHPLVRVVPIKWDFAIPFGLYYAQEPTGAVRRFIEAINR